VWTLRFSVAAALRRHLWRFHRGRWFVLQCSASFYASHSLVVFLGAAPFMPYKGAVFLLPLLLFLKGPPSKAGVFCSTGFSLCVSFRLCRNRLPRRSFSRSRISFCACHPERSKGSQPTHALKTIWVSHAAFSCVACGLTTAANSHTSPQTSSSLARENSRSISDPLHRLPLQRLSPRHTPGAALSFPTKDPLSLLASTPAG
jgi:hypothetical protein